MYFRYALPILSNEIKQSSKIALPLILAQVIYSINWFFIGSFITELGNTELAAYGLMWDTYSVLNAFLLGIFASTSILISQSLGAKNIPNIGITFNHGLWLVIFFAPIFIIITCIFPIILSYTNQDPIVMQLITTAFHALSWVILPYGLFTVIRQFFMGINKAYLVTVITVAISPIQSFLMYVLMLGKLGFPKLGINGVGYGLAASYYIVLIPVFFYLLYSKKFKPYELFKNLFKINFKLLYELIRLGVPIGFTLITEVGLFAVIAIMMGMLDKATLAAYELSHQYFTMISVVIISLLRTTAIRVGIEVGRNNKRALRFATLTNLTVGLVLVLLVSILYIYFPKFMIGLSTDSHSSLSPTFIATTSKFLSLVGILLIINCIRLIITGALRGLKDVKVPSIIIFASLWCIAIPCAYLLGFQLQLGGIGIWWGIIIGALFSIIILPFRFNILSKQTNLKTLVTKTL